MSTISRDHRPSTPERIFLSLLVYLFRDGNTKQDSQHVRCGEAHIMAINLYAFSLYYVS